MGEKIRVLRDRERSCEAGGIVNFKVSPGIFLIAGGGGLTALAWKNEVFGLVPDGGDFIFSVKERREYGIATRSLLRIVHCGGYWRDLVKWEPA